MRLRVGALLIAALAMGTASASDERVDLDVVHRIKDEAFRKSQVMDHLFYLTDVNGPRLTGSPGFKSAADWSIASLKKWGVADARTEKWGRFGRGWSLERFSAHLIEPAFAPLNGVVKAWSGGTSGEVTGDVVFAPVFEEKQTGEIWDLEALAKGIKEYAERQKGKLRGKIVLLEPVRPLLLPTQKEAERYDAAKLEEIAKGPDPQPAAPIEWPLTRLPADREERDRITARLPLEIGSDFFIRRRKVVDDLYRFLKDEAVLAVFAADRRGSGGVVFAEGVRSTDPDSPIPPPVVVLAPESYARIVRLVGRNVRVRAALDVKVKFQDSDLDAFNVVAEIPGGRKKDEIVMLGAHLDSWHGGTGASDNAAGCAVVLEAMRVLKALNLKTDRTVRLVLWSGEEQGLLGSRAYVREHFADPVTMALKPEYARLSGYFNLDNGSGKIRGVYLQGNDMVRPIFDAWLAPFHDLGATTLTIEDTGGTDHKAFDAVGLPGFQFIQDPLDYMTRTHHSDLDVYDHAVPSDLMQAAAVMASFVYNAATRPDMLPREPLPPPLPKPKTAGISAPADQPIPADPKATRVGLTSRADSLVTPEWLVKARGVALFHVAWGDAGDYRRAHIPGAVHFDTGRIERAPLWRLVGDAELERTLLDLGVTRSIPVVLYGKPTMAATRVALAFLYAGVEDVRILDGGLDAWRASGRPVETGDNPPSPAPAFGGPFPGRPEIIVHASEVKMMLGDADAVVVSVRSLPEQLGESSGYRDLEARGRIRGDVWGGAGSDANHMEEYENPDGTLKAPDAVAARWAGKGIVPGKRVAFYCGTGWRASLAFWDAWMLGWPRISVYDPGWYEWSRDPRNPIASGPLGEGL